MSVNIEAMSVNSLRMLSVDQINKANSGHPGITLGVAPMAYSLFSKFIRQNPKDPSWPNRDRFVLSPGHGSALLYSLLHLSGYDVSMDDIKNFRQVGSRTPGHPEVNHTPGVEATTGPLGQGFANSVGMAMAEAHLAALYNRGGMNIVDHYTYCIVSDGDLMEGISSEAASLAGHLGLGKLIVLYDSNRICLDGETDDTFTESVGLRFKAFDWQVLLVQDGNNLEALAEAIEHAKKETEKPTLIQVETTIGYGAPGAGTSKVHGAPLGEENTKALREFLNWEDEPFKIREEVYKDFNEKVALRGAKAQEEWEELFKKYEEAYPELAAQYKTALKGELPKDWDKELPFWQEGDPAIASRSSSEKVIQVIAKRVPYFWGGSADLSGSNKTYIKKSGIFSKDDYGQDNIFYGVREHAMASINNGIALHGGSKIFSSTFFVFSDYMRGAVRISALSGLPVIYVLSHDSVAVGEDGPTHQPIEQLATWRAMPNLAVIRPADANEVRAAWKMAMESKNMPTMIVTSRQNLPNLAGTKDLADEGLRRGAYILKDVEAEKEADGIIIATGSEVSIGMQAQEILAKEGIYVRLVSMPCMEYFEKQDREYKEQILPKSLKKRLVVEAGSSFGWDRYAGDEGAILSIDNFGSSGPGEKVMEERGMTAENVVSLYKDL